jgi:O-methyltransferase domain/Dimerisation domain
VNQPDTRAALRALVTGAWRAQCLRAAAQLGLADQLASGPMTSAELAAACAAHEPSLRRLLRVLAAMELLATDDAQRYSLTALGQGLRNGGLGPYAVYFASESAWLAWTALGHCVRTGQTGFGQAHGMGQWEYFAAHPDAAAQFQAAMGITTAGVTPKVAASYDFSRFPVVVDVGGGTGALLAEILLRSSRTRGVLVDLPHVTELARAVLRDAGVLERCELHSGDFMDSVPPGDCYVLKSVLHDWTDEKAVTILRRCREAASAASLVIVERVLPERPSSGDLEALLTDLNMMVMLGGRERTASEFGHLLAEAGFRLGAILPTGTEFSLIEAVAVTRP